MTTSITVMAAYLLDMVAGDPRTPAHPVALLGRLIASLERKVRRGGTSPALPEKLTGAILAGGVVSAVYVTVLLLVRISGTVHPMLEMTVSVLVIYSCIATRSLGRAAMDVRRALAAGDMDRARRELGMVVGRETGRLSPQEVVRGAVETTAENTVDGVIAPLFYAFLGGAPLCAAYRAINTLDSMWGYRNTEYLRFGWAAARLDDLANYIPARVAGLCLLLAGVLLGLDWRSGWKTMLRDGRKHPSPNGGIPEAVVAGLLGVQLGGVNYYAGVPSFRPYLGTPARDAGPTRIDEVVRVMFLASFLALLAGALLRWLWP